MLRTIAESLQSDRDELVKMIKETQATCREEDINKRKKRLILAQRRKEELEKLLCKIYEDHILEKIPDARYVMLDEQYAKEQAVLSNEIKEIEGTIQQYEKDQKSADQFITLDTVDKSVVLWYNEEKRTGVFLHGEQLSTARYVRCDVGNSQAVHNRKQGNVGRQRKGYPSISEWRVLDFENGSTMERPAAGIW